MCVTLYWESEMLPHQVDSGHEFTKIKDVHHLPKVRVFV
jgi:hypothetical protein